MKRKTGNKKERFPYKRVYILWNGKLIQEGLARLINRAQGLKTIGSAEPDISRIARALQVRPDVVIIPAWVSPIILSLLWAETKVLAITKSAWSEDMIEKAIKSGVKGLIDIDAQPKELINAIKGVVRGDYWIPRVHLEGIAREFTPVISNVEKRIIIMIYEGLTDKEIASKLNRSINTIRTHFRRLFRKFGVSNRAGLRGKTMSGEV